MSILPLPAQTENRSGSFQLSAETDILTDTADRWNAEYLRGLFAAPTGFPLRILTLRSEPQRKPERLQAKNKIQLYLNPEMKFLGREGYRLTVTPEAITVEALETTGIFYGIQSLRQLLPVEIEQRQLLTETDWRIPCQVITDQPRFVWRGFMLDEGRHFQGLETVLQTLD